MGRKIRDLKTTYTSGELDPALAAREDIKHYYNGADRIRNAIVIPQGGARRRPGLRWRDELWHKLTRLTGMTITAPHGGTTANANDNDASTVVLTTDAIGTTDPYVVVHYDLGAAVEIAAADVLSLTITVGTSSEFYIQHSTDDATWANFGPVLGTASTAAITRRRSNFRNAVSARYWRVAKIGGTDATTAVAQLQEFWLWTEGTELSNARLIEFQYSDIAHYDIVLTDFNAAVYLAGIWQTDIIQPLSSDQIAVCNWTQSYDTLLIFHPSKQTFKLLREGTDTVWGYYPITFVRGPGVAFPDSTDFAGASITPSAVTGSAITLTAGAAIFTTAHIGGYLRSDLRAGTARITAFTDSTHVTAEVLDDFTATTAFTDGEFRELAFSTTRGWPSCGTFHDNRLVCARTAQLPQHIFFSRTTNRFFDFNDAQALDDYAIVAELASDKVSSIYNLVSGRHLHILTSSAEWYALPNDAPITPNTIVYKRATETGSLGPGLRWAAVEGATLFVQKGGKSIREFVFIDTEQDYQANNVSLLSSQLIGVPVDFAQRKATATDEGDLVLACNTDGSLAALSTLRTQDVTAWSGLSTDGLFKNVAQDGSDVFFVIDRTVGGVTRRYLEQFDSTCYTDAAVTGTIPSQIFTATASQTDFMFVFAPVLDGSLIGVKVNGDVIDYLADYTVDIGTNTVMLATPSTVGDEVELFRTVLTVDGLDHLEGLTVQFRIDGAVAGSGTVASGSVDLSAHAFVSYEVGLKFPDVRGDGETEVWIRDMPIALQLVDGTLTGELKGVTQIVCKVLETQDIWLGANGGEPEMMVLQDFNAISDVDGALVLTGNVTAEGVLGYDEFGQVEVVQRQPAPMTLLGTAKTVDV